MGAPAGNIQAQYPEVAPELECCQLGHTGLIARGVNPTFHCQSTRTHHLQHQSGSFLFKWCFLINTYHCNKNGVKRPSSWSETPFWPISLKSKSTKGVPKRWKTNLHQICFIKPRMIWYHKGSPPVLFWDAKRPWLGRSGL